LAGSLTTASAPRTQITQTINHIKYQQQYDASSIHNPSQSITHHLSITSGAASSLATTTRDKKQ
jgi:hypothetical protein